MTTSSDTSSPSARTGKTSRPRGLFRRVFRSRWFQALAGVFLLPAAVFLYLGASIFLYSLRSSDSKADAAIVLGAAVWSNRPSPVFRERIDHAVALYRQGRVRKLLFTGGRAEGDADSEAGTARSHALKQGIPEEDILVEARSTRTYDNLRFARPIAETEGLHSFLVVSDPLHMRRAMTMAADLGLQAEPSPTPTTRYQSASAQGDFLLREIKFYAAYLLSRPFR